MVYRPSSEIEMSKGLPEISNVKRLRSIDALRGAAALGVVLYHMVGQHPQIDASGWTGRLAAPLLHTFSFGYTGVFLFFVISGFCIHLQWAKAQSAGRTPDISFVKFWKRRWRRLYPPYLIALFLFLTVSALTSRVAFTRFYFYDLGMHLAMLHNFDPHTSYSINGVFWTLAIEEQLYLAYFPLLFLRTRWGWRGTLACCAFARIGWLLLGHGLKSFFDFELPVTEAALTHWLTWALGAISVEAALGLIALPAWCRQTWYGLLALGYAAGLSYVLTLYDNSPLVHDLLWLTLHPAWGLGFFIVINGLVSAEKAWLASLSMPRIVKGLASIGLFSYSLYLTHELVIMQTWRVQAWSLLNLLPLSTMYFAIIVMTPLTVAAAWFFFLFCERPYLSKPSATRALPETSSTKEQLLRPVLENE
jgi:peptidoglycan/LPS O-acetylase OafA/YrhL